MPKVVVVGAGIVGLAVAARLAARGDSVTVLEKERDVALHQTGRNSGVIHSGVYYAPGSLKATMCVAGNRSMVEYAREHGAAVELCGKLIVATEEREHARLQALADRAAANGVPARLISPEEAREREPHVQCTRALLVESTGIVDYKGVSAALAEEVRAGDGEIRFGVRLRSARTTGDGVHIETDGASLTADALVNCAGLHSDRVAVASGVRPQARIVPFRGEYFELADARRDMVKGLIYPVPDPRFPFLGVHLTRMIDGSVHAGPNAVLAMAREGYTWGAIRPRDVASWAAWPGMWKMGARHLGTATGEVARSLSRRRFAQSLSRLVPGITSKDLVPAKAGVRAQAVLRDGTLADDFVIQSSARQVHVLNAPSPAATASLEIAKHIVGRLDTVLA